MSTTYYCHNFNIPTDVVNLDIQFKNSTLPDLSHLKNLKKLCTGNNELSALPEGLEELKHYGKSLPKLPESLKSLSTLAEEISHLPCNLEYLEAPNVKKLPDLPVTLVDLIADKLEVLSFIPQKGMFTLSINSVKKISTLPQFLDTLSADSVKKDLPPLPVAMRNLSLNGMIVEPLLPQYLDLLYMDNVAHITKLPSGLFKLSALHARSLPVLPETLNELDLIDNNAIRIEERHFWEKINNGEDCVTWRRNTSAHF